MSIFWTDTIEITPVTYDAETKVSTDGATVTVMGYWEEDSIIKQTTQGGSSDGNPIIYSDMVFFPIEVSIKEADKIRLLKKGNIDLSANPDYTNKRMVKKVNLESSLSNAHYEVKI